MTISTTIIKNSYSGNGSTSEFTYGFKVTDEDFIQVIIRSSTGTETVKTKTTHYTVSGVGDAAGGTAHAFSSGSFTEVRLCAKAAVQYINDGKANYANKIFKSN